MALGDAAAWVGAVASVLMAGYAIQISHRSLEQSRRSASAAERSAAEARRAADAAERQAIAAEKSVPPPPPDVAWRIEPAGNRKEGFKPLNQHEFVLRNVGVKPATGVKLSTGTRPFSGRLRFNGATDQPLPPEGSLPFLMVVAYGSSAPNELLVSWDGNPEGTWVSIPSKG